MSMLLPVDMKYYLKVYCAPCLLGKKPSSLFSLPVSVYRESLKEKRTLAKYGFALKLLYIIEEKAHVMLYSKKEIKQMLKKRDVQKAFSFFGYKESYKFEHIFSALSSRLRSFAKGLITGNREGFPHEVGLFLGYPPEDVLQYYINKGKGYIFSGYWKVYTNPSKAYLEFKKYDEAKAYCMNMPLFDIDKLFIA